ncbi:hydroxyquinol 1,2-dioxygenase [Cupriavidus oxalaticus]|uniref:hydroxyquinol 1,2-dioxygenase n=1 Tax=Cupriavidus oxalaticus TaxID=96344 RepID=UPI003176CBBB
MSTSLAKRFLLAISLVAAAAGAQAAGPSATGARDPYTDSARSVTDPRDPYTDGARSVQEPRSPYSDGARKFDPYSDGARTSTALGLTGASADPAQGLEPIPTAPARGALNGSSSKAD